MESFNVSKIFCFKKIRHISKFLSERIFKVMVFNKSLFTYITHLRQNHFKIYNKYRKDVLSKRFSQVRTIFPFSGIYLYSIR